MKKKVLLLIAMGVMHCALYAQSGNVGIGTNAPSSKLTVNGNASVGSGFTGTAAPANGAIIEGNTGIGTATPGTNLQVVGGIAGGTAFGISGTAPVHNIYVELAGNTALPAPAANGQILFVKNNTGATVTLSKGYTGGLFDAYSAADVPSMNVVALGHKMFIGFIVPGFTGWIAQLSLDPSFQPSNFWNTKGSAGTNSGNNFIGTSDNASLSISTNNVQRMYIDSASGKVGIGTSAPAGTTHIVNNGTNGSAVGPASTPNIALRMENTQNGQAVIEHMVTKNSSGVTKELASGINPNFATNGLYLMTRNGSSVDFGMDMANGNIGLGTVPTTKLDVNGTVRIRSTPTPAVGYDYPLSPLYVDPSGNVVKNRPLGDGDQQSVVTPLINPGDSIAVYDSIPDNHAFYLQVAAANGCAYISIANFWVLCYSANNQSAVMGINGVLSSNGTSLPTFSETQTTSHVTWAGLPSCADGSNTTAFNYGVIITQTPFHKMYIKNNGNIARSYSIKLVEQGTY